VSLNIIHLLCSRRLALIDGGGILKFANIESGLSSDTKDMQGTLENLDKFERKDVWDMKWAEVGTIILTSVCVSSVG